MIDTIAPTPNACAPAQLWTTQQKPHDTPTPRNPKQHLLQFVLLSSNIFFWNLSSPPQKRETLLQGVIPGNSSRNSAFTFSLLRSLHVSVFPCETTKSDRAGILRANFAFSISFLSFFLCFLAQKAYLIITKWARTSELASEKHKRTRIRRREEYHRRFAGKKKSEGEKPLSSREGGCALFLPFLFFA